MSKDLLVRIMEQNANQSAAIHNRVMDNYERQIAELRKNYRKLFFQVASANRLIDSMRIDAILDEHEWEVNR